MYCNEVFPLERLEILKITDELLADSIRRCPTHTVKKTYSRLAVLPRLAVIEGGVIHPEHEYTETSSCVSGYFEFEGKTTEEIRNALNAVDLTDWIYTLCVTTDEATNWITAVKVDNIQDVEGGVRINVRTTDKQIVDKCWTVTEISENE